MKVGMKTCCGEKKRERKEWYKAGERQRKDWGLQKWERKKGVEWDWPKQRGRGLGSRQGRKPEG